MSRGPGRWQRMILDAVEANPVGGVVLTRADDPHSVQNAVRRAANQLEKAGRITLTAVRIDGTNRLMAFPADVEPPPHQVVTGLDRKAYRRPI